MKRTSLKVKYGEPADLKDGIHLIMRGVYVTGWSTCKAFAKSCAGRGERVVTVGSW